MLTGKNRINTDKFYTNIKTVDLCFQLFKKYIKDMLVIEPSAGNGAFLNVLNKYKHMAFDIQPDNPAIKEQDFLTLDLDSFNQPLVFLGNPPFGKQSSLAKKFIKHITKCQNTTVIGFILSKSFKKESMQKCFPLNYWLVEQINLPDDAFNIGGKVHDVPCVFQIWQKKENNRIVTPCPPSKFVEFVKFDGNPDFSLRRVGVYAGKIDIDLNKSNQSHYFIKMRPGFDSKLFYKEYKTIVFPHDNTTGPKSISKKEFIIAMNQLSL